jgi:hypothetical protein
VCMGVLTLVRWGWDYMCMAHAGGIPSKYSKKLGNRICQRISNGESLRAILRMHWGLQYITS